MKVPKCDEFMCELNKICIPYSWLCDGYNDCGKMDFSDEKNCRMKTLF